MSVFSATGRTKHHHGSNRTTDGRAALIFIFITVALDILAFGIIIPVLPS